ncbi:L-mandelate dehydrogenase [Thozetella sp. PMI_491]|nr:L-mandelate dehydrogenase [Thozetella sp. PMI_491]
MISYEEVQRHATVGNCWVIIKGFVYDVSDFLELHPGGRQAILSHAGKDVSELFTMLHPPDALENLMPEACLGPVDPSTLPPPGEAVTEDESEDGATHTLPQVEDMLLIQDFETWAERVLSRTAWAYYRSATDEEMTFHENRKAFQRYFFRPRVLSGEASTGATDTAFVGIPTTLPVFISPAALAKLGHPLGEINLTKAAGDYGIVQAISANASCSVDELFAARMEGQHLIYQLYLNKNRSASEKLIRKVEQLGAKAIIFTVDISGDSKRTLDERSKSHSRPPIETSNGTSAPSPATPVAVGQSIAGYQERNLTWKDIPFIRRNTKLPIIVKGVQCLEDVQLCAEHGVNGVIISNHGGRQADYAPAPIDVLYEIRCLRPDLFDKIDIMIDGGVRSGADVVKALALGAKAVGLGRPFLYANGTHGQDGVRRVLEILHEEIVNTMRNIGAAKIDELRPEMVGPAGPWVGTNRPPYMTVPRM